MKNNLKKFVFIILAFFVISCAELTSVRSKNGYENQLMGKNSILVLPSTAEVYEVGASSKDRKYDYESYLEKILDDEITILLKNKGYFAHKISKAKAHEKGIYGEILHIKDANLPEIDKLFNPYEIDVKLASNVDFVINRNLLAKIHNATKADVVALLHYHGYSKTSGARALDFAFGVLTGVGSAITEGSNLSVSLIDVRTGSLLWSNIAFTVEGIFSSGWNSLSSAEEIDRKNVNKLGKILFKKLPDKTQLGTN